MSQQPQDWGNNDIHLAGIAGGLRESWVSRSGGRWRSRDGLSWMNPSNRRIFRATARPIDNNMVLALRQLHINLAITSWKPSTMPSPGEPRRRQEISLRKGHGARRARTRVASGSSRPDPVAGSADPVIRSLSDAMAATERAYDRHSGIQADALRLAMVVRLLALQSEAPRPAQRGELADEHSGERQVRALQKWRLKRVVEYIDNHLCSKISLMDLAVIAGLSRMHFASQFRVATGLRPHDNLLRRRIHRAEELLTTSTMTIVEIALTVGFQTQAHFTTVFKRFVGHTPYQWRNAHWCGKVSRGV